MGNRIFQRILSCDKCGKTPAHGEPLWQMRREHWCERCCEDGEREEPPKDGTGYTEDDDTSNLMGG